MEKNDQIYRFSDPATISSSDKKLSFSAETERISW